MLRPTILESQRAKSIIFCADYPKLISIIESGSGAFKPKKGGRRRESDINGKAY